MSKSQTTYESSNDYVTDEPSGPSPSNGGEHNQQQQPTGTGKSRAATNGDVNRNEGLIAVERLNRDQMQPSYAQDLGLASIEHGFYGSMMNCLGAVVGNLGAVPCCFCCPNPYKEVYQGSVGLISRFGQFYKSVDPGLVKINPFSEELTRIDVKIQIAPIPAQTVMTRDNVNVSIESVLYYHITNPYKAAFGISNVRVALVERAQTTLRHVVGARNLQSILTEREAVASEIEQIVEGVSEKWGVSIESILIKDIIFSQELQQSLSSAAQQKRIGESKVIAARAEVDAARLMREAADILSSPAAIQIRQLEALQNMARQSGSKTIFVPMHLLQTDGASVGGSGGMGGNGGASGGSNTNVDRTMMLERMSEN